MTEKPLGIEALERAVIEAAEKFRAQCCTTAGVVYFPGGDTGQVPALVAAVDALRTARHPKWRIELIGLQWYASLAGFGTLCFGSSVHAERWAREFVALRMKEAENG